MEEIILKAAPRSETPKKVRKAGFIPGVLNGPDTVSTAVQFESVPLYKIIAKHGTSAKLWILLGTEKKLGFIKEVQKHPVEGKIIHISIQMVSEDQNVKMQLPIVFHGQNNLEHKLLQIQVNKSEIEVEGKAALIPEEIIVDLSEKECGENITAADFNLSNGIKILDAKDEIYATIKSAKNEVAEEPEEAAPAEEAK
jgi:large subunit ribosomal protein L25